MVALTVARVSVDRSTPWAGATWVLAALGIVLAVVAVFGWSQRRGRRRQEAEFAVTGRGFGASSWLPLGFVPLAQTLMASVLTAPAVETWRDVLVPDPDIGAEEV